MLPSPKTRTLNTDCQFQNPLELPGWDDLLKSHPDACFFHSAAWAEVLVRSYGHIPCYLVRRQNKRLEGLLALMEVNSPWTGRRGVSLPFSDACPPLLDNATPLDALLHATLDLGHRRAWRYVEIRGVNLLPEGGTPSLRYTGHTLRLSRDEEEVTTRLKPAVRRAIRKAVREGVEADIETSYEAVRTFYDLHCKTRQRHGLPPQPLYFFENIFRSVLSKNLGFVSVARWRGRPMAAAVFLHHGPKATFKYGASDPSCQQFRGNDLAMAEGIRWLCCHGSELLDFGRTERENEGLRRYKKGFGAQEYEINYLKYDFRKEQFVRDPDRASGWQRRVFRQMPRAVSRLVGRLLYGHLS